MKRVLIVSYVYPPVTNMGSHRIRRFVRHLPEFGWQPVLLTAPGAEQTPGAEIHSVAGVDLTALWRKIKGAPTGGGGSSQAVTTSLNRWVMIPDKYFPWIKTAARAGAALKDIDAIYSTSDPLSDHLVALRISRETGVPFVAEFRDLWMGNPYFARAHPTPLHRALHARLERKVVTGASSIVGLSRGIAGYFEREYNKQSRVIYNCFDPDEYAQSAPPAERFTVVYAGALYSSRSPEPFLAGFAQFVKQHDDARFVIVGGSPDLDLPAMVIRHGLTGHVELIGRVSHAEALRRMQAASVLLAVQSPEDDIHVPGKLFEYLGAGRPVLAMSRPGEVPDLIRQYNLGWVAEPTVASVVSKLEEAYRNPSLAAKGRDRFSVKESTRQLAAVLDEVAGKR